MPGVPHCYRLVRDRLVQLGDSERGIEPSGGLYGSGDPEASARVGKADRVLPGLPRGRHHRPEEPVITGIVISAAAYVVFHLGQGHAD